MQLGEISNVMVDEVKLQNYPNRAEKLAITNRIKFNNDMCAFSYIGAKYQLYCGERKQIPLATLWVEKLWTFLLVLTLGGINHVRRLLKKISTNKAMIEDLIQI